MGTDSAHSAGQAAAAPSPDGRAAASPSPAEPDESTGAPATSAAATPTTPAPAAAPVSATGVTPAPCTGLSAAEVAARVAAGQVNVDAGVKTRSVATIARENICTLFNAVNLVLAVFVLFTGSFKNMLFMIVIVCNTVIGIVQEVRSKRVTDRLSIVAGSHATVVRDGREQQIALDGLVRDDVIVLGRGDQVPADCEAVAGACDANESLLTGESKLVKKRPGDTLMSGSFVNAGRVYARVVHVGAENYAAKISAEAKEHKAVNSEIMRSLNRIIKTVSCIMFPIGALLFAREFFVAHTELNSAILSTVSALVGMIPEGLILLTSTVLAVAVVRLAQSKVLVQQLYCIETLARVDVLCLDKTGTITTGDMEVFECEAVAGAEDAFDEAQAAFLAIAAADDNPNETALAVRAYFEGGAQAAGAGKGRRGRRKRQAARAMRGEDEGLRPLPVARFVPFSSDRKWSGALLEGGGSYVMGAAQFVLGEGYTAVQAQAEELAADARLLLLARVEGFDDDGRMLGTPAPLAFVRIRDQIRATAAETIGYFKEQGVRCIVISGDDPRTVSGIAGKVGIEHADDFVDATELETDADVEAALAHAGVFGRVKPEQKKAFVLALQKAGHTVAMTGDGVNDTLALKAADCGVAMAAGSDAARNVAHLVLVDNDFASMPKVVAEGRRSINNLQRSASLFLVKTLLSIVSAVLFVLVPWQYPFQPIQMTLISSFTIGIPSFVLALEPNHERVKGHFLENVIVRSIPGAAVSVISIVVVNWVGYAALGLDYAQVSTLCVLTTSWVGLNLVFRLSLPFTPIRAALLVFVVAGLAAGVLFFPRLFVIAAFTPEMLALAGCVAAGAAVAFHIFYARLDAWHSARMARLV